MKKILFILLVCISYNVMGNDSSKFEKRLSIKKIERISKKTYKLSNIESTTQENEGFIFDVQMEMYSKKTIIKKEVLKYQYKSNDSVIKVIREYYFNNNALIMVTNRDFINGVPSSSSKIYFVDYRYMYFYDNNKRVKLSSDNVYSILEEIHNDLSVFLYYFK